MAVVLPLAVSCLEPVHIDDNQYEPAVYFINSGYTRSAEFYDVQGSMTCKIPVFCGSMTEAAPTVTVQVDESCLEEYNRKNYSSYKVLPADCYTLGEPTFALNDRRGTTSIEFDCVKLAAFAANDDYSDLSQYVVPLKLINRTSGIIEPKDPSQLTMLLSPNMSQLKFNFLPPFKGQTSKDRMEMDGEYYVLTYSVETRIENKWNTNVWFEFNTSGKGQTYSVVPDGAYTVEKTEDSFVSGVNTVSFSVKIKRSLFRGPAYSVYAKVIVGEGRGQREYESLLDIMGALKKFPQENISVNAYNSHSGSSGELPEASLDGNQKTYWQPNWGSGFGVLHYQTDENYYELSYKFNEPVSISAVGISRRNDMLDRADIKDCKLSWSEDGSNWSDPIDYRFSTGSLLTTDDPESLIYMPDDIRMQYFKVQCVSSYRAGGNQLVLANITEFNAYESAEI